MGTANALAHDLGLPMRVAAAAKAVLRGTKRRIALGQVTCPNMSGVSTTRYFTVAAGVGVDAHLFYKLHSGVKQKLGMAAYYAKAWHMWFSYHMTRFQLQYSETGSNAEKTADVTELLAVRIRNFGGVVQHLAPGASLARDDIRLVFCRTGSRLAYLTYVAGSMLRRAWNVPGIERAYSTKARCDYSANDAAAEIRQKIYVEADGELLGSLPAEFTIVPDALTVLGPGQ